MAAKKRARKSTPANIRELRKTLLTAQRQLGKLFDGMQQDGAGVFFDPNVAGAVENLRAMTQGLTRIATRHVYELIRIGSTKFGSEWTVRVRERSAHLGYIALECPCKYCKGIAGPASGREEVADVIRHVEAIVAKAYEDPSNQSSP